MHFFRFITPFFLIILLTIPRVLLQSFIVVTLPVIINGLGLTSLQAKLVTPTTLIGTMVFLIPAGMIGDRYGPKITIIYTSIAFFFISIFAAYCHSPVLFLILVFLLGVTTAFGITQGSSYVADIYPFEMRGRIIGTYTGLISLTFYLGPVVGGLVAEWGIKGIFLSNLPLLLIGLIFAKILPKLHKEEKAIVKKEYKNYFNKSFLSHCMIGLFWQGIIALISFFPAEFQVYLNLSPIESGILYSMLSIPFPLFSPIAGWLFDKMGFKIPYVIGYVALFFAWFLSFNNLNLYALCVMAFALAYVLPVSASASWGLFNQDHRSTANSIYFLLRFVGSLIGNIVAGYILFLGDTSKDFFYFNYSIAIFLGILSLPAFFYVYRASSTK